jgi:hypothetical protein
MVLTRSVAFSRASSAFDAIHARKWVLVKSMLHNDLLHEPTKLQQRKKSDKNVMNSTK